MGKKRALVICCLTALLIAAGCGGMQWKHEYKSQTELRNDFEECQRDVRSWRRGYTGGEDAFNEQILINECMQNKGWYR